MKKAVGTVLLIGGIVMTVVANTMEGWPRWLGGPAAICILVGGVWLGILWEEAHHKQKNP